VIARRRTTVTLDGAVYRALKAHSASTGRTVSQTVNAILRDRLDLDEDQAAFSARRSEREVPLAALVVRLRARGRL